MRISITKLKNFPKVTCNEKAINAHNTFTNRKEVNDNG